MLYLFTVGKFVFARAGAKFDCFLYYRANRSVTVPYILRTNHTIFKLWIRKLTVQE